MGTPSGGGGCLWDVSTVQIFSLCSRSLPDVQGLPESLACALLIEQSLLASVFDSEKSACSKTAPIFHPKTQPRTNINIHDKVHIIICFCHRY